MRKFAIFFVMILFLTSGSMAQYLSGSHVAFTSGEMQKFSDKVVRSVHQKMQHPEPSEQCQKEMKQACTEIRGCTEWVEKMKKENPSFKLIKYLVKNEKEKEFVFFHDMRWESFPFYPEYRSTGRTNQKVSFIYQLGTGSSSGRHTQQFTLKHIPAYRRIQAGCGQEK